MRPATHPHRTARIAAAVVLGALALAGCADDHGHVRGPSLRVPACGEAGAERTFAPFELPLTLFGLTREGPLVFIRMQAHGQALTDDDALVVQVADAPAIEAALATSATVRVPLNDDRFGARAALHLAARCPGAFAPLELADGDILFTALGTGVGDRVRATLPLFSVRDGRTGDVYGDGITAEFEFTVVGRPPYEYFAR